MTDIRSERPSMLRKHPPGPELSRSTTARGFCAGHGRVPMPLLNDPLPVQMVCDKNPRAVRPRWHSGHYQCACNWLNRLTDLFPALDRRVGSLVRTEPGPNNAKAVCPAPLRGVKLFAVRSTVPGGFDAPSSREALSVWLLVSQIYPRFVWTSSNVAHNVHVMKRHIR